MARSTNGTTIKLKQASNGELIRHGAGHLEFRFPARSGYLQAGRSEFREPAELTDYLAELLGIEPTAGGLRGSLSRAGKYDRRTADGGRAFTFGDPILDLITDPAGIITIGGQRYDLSTVELESPRYRSGGINRIDLGILGDELRAHQVRQAALGQGDFTLIECSSDVVALASTNPSQRDFYQSGDHLRFKAWKKNYTFYWSIGAEIETWGHDFDRARIESTYIDTFYAQVCFVVKRDSDSDTDDDYVDEYEWGVASAPPRRVISQCTAEWHGLDFRGQVEAGPPCYTIGDIDIAQ